MSALLNISSTSSLLKMLTDDLLANLSWTSLVYDHCLAGINFSLAGNGGPACAEYIPFRRRCLEAGLAVVCCIVAVVIGWKIHNPPNKEFANSSSRHNKSQEISHSPFRLFLLGSLAFAYGLEFCYKWTTRQLIFILNPCHILCLIQLYLLACPSNEFNSKVNFLFRLHLSQLYLPVVAFVCPVTNTLFQPGEVFTYYFEHVLLLAIPLYLIIWGGPSFKPEPFLDIGYSLFAYASFGVFNFVLLQPLAETTLANLNSILCPAIADPFAGFNYRLHALWHQLPQAIFGAKLYGLLGIMSASVISSNSFDLKKD